MTTLQLETFIMVLVSLITWSFVLCKVRALRYYAFIGWWWSFTTAAFYMIVEFGELSGPALTDLSTLARMQSATLIISIGVYVLILHRKVK